LTSREILISTFNPLTLWNLHIRARSTTVDMWTGCTRDWGCQKRILT